MRKSGILLPIASLPGPYGIGSFGKEAYAFIDQLKRSAQSYWQILPLGPSGYGDSPYQSFSTFAGNPYYISIETLIEEGYLQEEEAGRKDVHEEEIDYLFLYETRFALLRKAFQRSHIHEKEEFHQFVKENTWLEDYALFMALKDEHEGAPWEQWEEMLRLRQPQALDRKKEELREEIDFYKFIQFVFWTQWKRLKQYANQEGIEIIGDIPIYVAYDSADTWAHPQLFQLDETARPEAVAGVPPDGFSADGQLWGNPLYRWEKHREDGYAWWIRRIRYCKEIYDVIRIDHFRGFDEYFSIPYGDSDARGGHWEKGPGYELFAAVKKALGEVEIIAEDLGYLKDSVKELVKRCDFPGMKIIEFAFDARDSSGANDYLPHNYEKRCVVYSGTHDNETLMGWFSSITPEEKETLKRYLCTSTTCDEELVQKCIAMAMASVADTCIIPMQDHLWLDNRARINTPSTLGGNWVWRLKKEQFSKQIEENIKTMTGIYGRCPKGKEKNSWKHS